ncbi:substrate-binding periplasmic protein [Leeia oryzae]|uniref:substrate-binding periplasmic protein n=1 Tax=Leeia oryzae TaxID=356662 RepID=UPI00036B0A7A|nr:transporter substrate-binding domain-containing protein [Leeia oryzae]
MHLLTKACLSLPMLLICGLASLAQGESLSIAATDYKPYISDQLPDGGILTRVLTEVLQKQGADYQLITVPNNRAIEGAMQGAYDATFGWAYTPERAQKMLYSDPIATFKMVFFQRKANRIHWTSMQQLTPYPIGVTKGNFVSKEFSALSKQGKLKVDEAFDDLSGLRKLLMKRIDLFPMEIEAGQYLIQSSLTVQEQQDLVPSDEVIWQVPVYFLINRNVAGASEFMSKFNQILHSLKEQGKLDAAYRDTKAKIDHRVLVKK